MQHNGRSRSALARSRSVPFWWAVLHLKLLTSIFIPCVSVSARHCRVPYAPHCGICAPLARNVHVHTYRYWSGSSGKYGLWKIEPNRRSIPHWTWAVCNLSVAIIKPYQIWESIYCSTYTNISQHFNSWEVHSIQILFSNLTDIFPAANFTEEQESTTCPAHTLEAVYTSQSIYKQRSFVYIICLSVYIISLHYQFLFTVIHLSVTFLDKDIKKYCVI